MNQFAAMIDRHKRSLPRVQGFAQVAFCETRLASPSDAFTIIWKISDLGNFGFGEFFRDIFAPSNRIGMSSTMARRLTRFSERFMDAQCARTPARMPSFAALLSLLICAPAYADARFDPIAVSSQDEQQKQEPVDDGNEINNADLIRELELFRAAKISMREALTAARRLHNGSRVVDISFDGASGVPLYRVKTCQGNHIWDDAIDANTGEPSGGTIESSINDLKGQDRTNVIALKAVRQEMMDAIRVAEKSASGKAISGGLIDEDGRVNFLIVVVSGSDLKQVILEPPTTTGRRSPQTRQR
jgi:uncharacterized membrane protein YkoI